MSYIIATIKIPIEIKKDGSTVPMINRTEIEFTKSNELPPEKENPNAFVIKKLSCFLKLQEEKEKEKEKEQQQQQQQEEEQEEKEQQQEEEEQEEKEEEQQKEEEEQQKEKEEEQEQEQEEHDEKEEENTSISFSNQFTKVEKEQIVKLFVNKDEIKNNHKKRGQTTTFKRTSKIKNKRKFTEKLRPPITEEDGDADSVQ
jgi:hypothetical protein